MVTGELKSRIDRVWDAFWSGGISNPLEVIEQITYLLFIRRLDEMQTLKENRARVSGDGRIVDPVFLPDQRHLRWSRFENADPDVMHQVVAELGEATALDLPGATPGTNLARFRAKAAAYLREHEDHVALQRLRRNRQLAPDDLASLEEMLVAGGVGQPVDVSWAAEQFHGLGLFIRSLVGLDHQAATEAFGHYLDRSRFTVDQVRFVGLIVDELTANGVVEPGRLFESPYTDHAPTGPDALFSGSDVDRLVDILREVKDRAVPGDVA
ncbi:MAG: Type I restriction-modification system, DNA-methyltransferase subunit M [uncultured Pseudonocardia sp.]|uniref:Type I restriction-modification system, DNA-methyltransferase subunit M n=1 Tax=uncultured Pseudonocardia sp. TaxID=211455 RepID=A0A6J4QTI9_9PSEU|nr:MAG: Type I restriction-modification system, DNA-methyltransferase subunit M [uncultured Pseudonocardia sp.]